MVIFALMTPAVSQIGPGTNINTYCSSTGSPPYAWLPCNPSGGGGGAVTIANGADTAEGSTTDSPATVPTNGTAATTIALLKALTNVANSPAQLAVNVTPTDCSGTVVTGNTAVNAFTAQTTLHGFTILNDDTSEPLWISFTTTAAAATAGSYPLAAATPTTYAGVNSYTSPPGFGTNHALSVVAATNGHKFSCTWW